MKNISIHALREEGDGGQVVTGQPHGISIHALREEGDRTGFINFPNRGIFLSTPSARRATGRLGGGKNSLKISIHALREEGDFFYV